MFKSPEERQSGELYLLNRERSDAAKKDGKTSLAEFYMVAKEGVETPVYPDVLLRLRDIYLSGKSANMTPEELATEINKDTKVTHPHLQPMSAQQVSEALSTYFGITVSANVNADEKYSVQ